MIELHQYIPAGPPLGPPLTVAGAIQVTQVKQALLSADPAGLVAYNIPPGPYDITNIAWHAPQAAANGTLYNFIETKLFAGNTANMAAFWVVAATVSSLP